MPRGWPRRAKLPARCRPNCFRFWKPKLPKADRNQPICLGCHDEAESLKPAVTEKLQALYPTDKGVGYAVGQIRGAMTLRKAL